MKNLLWCFVVAIAIVLTLNPNFFKSKNTKTFSVTADTNVSQVKGLSKYVTQEEVDGFAFRRWDIDYNSNPKNIVNEPQLDRDLKLLLKSKQTDKILKFMNDNNISVNHTMYSGVTPIMYSAFWNDTNTTQKLINLGADISKKDKYKLWSMAYAIQNNSIDVVKLLLNNGVKFDEVEVVQGYNFPQSYSIKDEIEQILVDENNTIEYKFKSNLHKSPGYVAVEPFYYVVTRNLVEIANLMLQNDYKTYIYYYGDDNIDKRSNSFEDVRSKEEFNKSVENFKQRHIDPSDEYLRFYIDDKKYYFTLYRPFGRMANYEKMLDLLLDNNISGLPSKDLMKYKFNECRGRYKDSIHSLVVYIYETTHGIEREKERLLVEEYQKKYYKQGQGSISEIINLLIKNGIIVRKPKSLDELDELSKFKMKQYTDSIKFYEKHCGIKDFKIESLMDWDTEEKKKKDPFGTVVNWEKEPIDENETFESIKNFFAYVNDKEKYTYAFGFVKEKTYLLDKNMTYIKYENIIKEKELDHKQQIEKEVKELKSLMKEKFKK